MDFTADLNSFVAYCQNQHDKHMEESYKNNSYPAPKSVYEIINGSKYSKVIVRDENQSSGSAYCFVEKTTGNIYRPASWNAPAKHARANIYSKESWVAAGVYGIAYLR